jgi:hypothetical protein
MSVGAKPFTWLAALAVVMGGLVFASAGRVAFWCGWAFLTIFFGA